MISCKFGFVILLSIIIFKSIEFVLAFNEFSLVKSVFKSIWYYCLMHILWRSLKLTYSSGILYLQLLFSNTVFRAMIFIIRSKLLASHLVNESCSSPIRLTAKFEFIDNVVHLFVFLFMGHEDAATSK